MIHDLRLNKQKIIYHLQDKNHDGISNGITQIGVHVLMDVSNIICKVSHKLVTADHNESSSSLWRVRCNKTLTSWKNSGG